MAEDTDMEKIHIKFTTLNQNLNARFAQALSMRFLQISAVTLTAFIKERHLKTSVQ